MQSYILPQSAQPNTEEEEDEDEDEEEEEEEQEQEQDDTNEQLPLAPVRFMSVWKAVNGKETLPGTQSAVLTEYTVYFSAIKAWRDKVLLDLLPRKFKIQQLEAIASYEKARACDICQQQIVKLEDLWQAIEIVKEWHERWPLRSLRIDFTLSLIEEKEAVLETPALSTFSQRAGDRIGGRRTATQTQLSTLPELLAIEEDAGNLIHKIADKWSCANKHCSNYPKTCWRNSSSTAPDHVLHHYPVNSEILARWNRELLKGDSTIDQPSQNVIVQLVNWKERDRKSNKMEQPKEKDSLSIDNLIKFLLVKELKSQPQQAAPSLYYSAPNQPQISSPVRSETDPVELLGLFFDWLIEQPEFSNAKQREILKPIKEKLMEEMWNIDTLKASNREGEGMTNKIWQAYEFKIGMLVRIRGKISGFKQSR